MIPATSSEIWYGFFLPIYDENQIVQELTEINDILTKMAQAETFLISVANRILRRMIKTVMNQVEAILNRFVDIT